MEALILYATRYGCTQKCANQLAQKLGEGAEVINLAAKKVIDLSPYPLVILGGSITAGKINKEITGFVNKNLDQLLAKKIGLFLCCLEQGEKAEKQMEEGFGAPLTQHAEAKGFLGGEIDLNKLNFVFRGIIKKMLKTDQNVSSLSPEKLDNFAVSIREAIDNK